MKKLRVVLQEVLACGVLLPLVNQLSDPDYINQFVIWMVSVGAPHCQLSLNKCCGWTDVDALAQIRDSSCNYEAFMNILKLTDKPAELEAVKDKVAEELQYLRSLDTAGDGAQQPASCTSSLSCSCTDELNVLSGGRLGL